jgi:DnaK suppressor protein
MVNGQKKRERLRPDGSARERRRKLERILRERRRLTEEAPAARPIGPDPIDVAREQEEEMVWLAVLDRSYDLQVQVDEAMGRLARGEYGLCMDCGTPIGMRRLRALPFALRCLRCQERAEMTTDWGLRHFDTSRNWDPVEVMTE